MILVLFQIYIICSLLIVDLDLSDFTTKGEYYIKYFQRIISFLYMFREIEIEVIQTKM